MSIYNSLEEEVFTIEDLVSEEDVRGKLECCLLQEARGNENIGLIAKQLYDVYLQLEWADGKRQDSKSYSKPNILKTAVNNYLNNITIIDSNKELFNNKSGKAALFVLDEAKCKEYYELYNEYKTKYYSVVDEGLEEINSKIQFEIFDEETAARIEYMDSLDLTDDTILIEWIYTVEFYEYAKILLQKEKTEARAGLEKLLTVKAKLNELNYYNDYLIEDSIIDSLTLNLLLKHYSLTEALELVYQSFINGGLTYNKWCTYYNHQEEYKDLPIEWWSKLV